jgi:Negative regulator of sigma F
LRDKEIDAILKRAAQGPEVVEPTLLARVAKSIECTMIPVRPVLPTWLLAGELFLACLMVAVAGAARLGFGGFGKLNVVERALIFPALGIFVWLAATAWVNEMIPGSRHRVTSRTLLGFGSVVLAAVFALLFHDYHTEHFVSAGIVCLIAGLLHAIPMAIIGWLILRRGFAVDSVTAGLAAGTLAGLAGVAMLELHCANLQALHVSLWHTAVVPVSAAAGALIGWALRIRLIPRSK